MNRASSLLLVVTTASLTGCASSVFQSTWKAPDAAPLQVQGAKVIAVAMMTEISSRRAAEDALAREITLRGAVGIPMYSIAPNVSTNDEAGARAAIEAAGAEGVVVMRPLGVDRETVTDPMVYSAPMYGGYWGGYYGAGWGAPYGGMVYGGGTYTNTLVSVETLIYSMRQNKLVWGGRSRTTNPESLDALIAELSEAVSKELRKAGLTGR